MDCLLSNDFTGYMYAFFLYLLQLAANEILDQEACYYDPNITFFQYKVNYKIIIGKYMPDLFAEFWLPFFQ